MSAPSIAIVGAGPAGLFTAQALRRALPTAPITVIDRLPVPFGLLRYGVAPDHQGTKAIARQFERLFERENVRFCGGIEVGADLPLETLRRGHTIVVLAAGLQGDRPLAIPGDDLPGIIGSGRLTRWFNDHPDEAGFDPPIGRRVAIIGNGNVALDIARIFAKSEAEFAGSDLSPRTLARISAAGVEEIVVIGRGQADAARFDPALLKEFTRLGETHVKAEVAGSEASQSPVATALREIDGTGALPGNARRRLTFRFGLTPKHIRSADGALVLHLARTSGDGNEAAIATDTVITAIGFDAGRTGLPRTEWLQGDGTLAVRIAPGLYASGWFRRGPRGTIPDNRAEAREVADRIVADVSCGAVPAVSTDIQADLFARAVSYAGWTAIRDREIAEAPAGRVRIKCPTAAQMRAIAAGAPAP
ncbi:MAG TPA: FAD-dependent oxidoreductase [Beijerinckiaceae bacterium]|nr:FAD-dependent oxidoreductase [Beijerinckiaceae bacterium]